jgi:hypothetical protein
VLMERNIIRSAYFGTVLKTSRTELEKFLEESFEGKFTAKGIVPAQTRFAK